jgi:hypothetical protein
MYRIVLSSKTKHLNLGWVSGSSFLNRKPQWLPVFHY